MKFELVPYVSVGPIKFGSSAREVRKAMGALPDYVYGERPLERYGNTSVYYDWDPPHVVAIRNGTTGTEGFLLRGFGPLGMSFAEACQAFGGAGAIVRPRGICNFEYGVTFELKSGQTAQARDYIFTACGPESLWLSKWRNVRDRDEDGERRGQVPRTGRVGGPR